LIRQREGGLVAFKLVCADTGAKCPFEVVAPTREELMEHVAVHAKMAHPEMAAAPPSPETIAKLIQTV
jgi:predicted small metal-binding protein